MASKAFFGVRVLLGLGFFLSAFGTAAQSQVAGSGTISGVFENPQPFEGGDLVVTGVGTSVFTTGIPFSESDFSTGLAFTPLDFVDQIQGESFVAGFIDYTNGTTDGGSASSVELVLNAFSDDDLFVQMLVEPIRFLVTTNSTANTPEQNADVIFFDNRPELGGFRVLEGETAQVEVLVAFNSLDLVGFGEVLTPETGFVSEDPLAEVPRAFSVVPAPGALWLLVSALLLAAPLTRRPLTTRQTDS